MTKFERFQVQYPEKRTIEILPKLKSKSYQIFVPGKLYVSEGNSNTWLFLGYWRESGYNLMFWTDQGYQYMPEWIANQFDFKELANEAAV